MKKPAPKKPTRPKHILKADWDSVDSPPFTTEQLKGLRPAAEVFPELVAACRRSRGRPPAETTKVPVSIRLSPEVVSFFKSRNGTTGWQTRINRALEAIVEAAR